MRGSNSSTIDGAGRRSYLGGASEANAERTVLRDTFNTRAIILIGNPSARCNLRISAQSSTDNTPSSSRPDQGQETRKGVKIRAATRGQFSGGADTGAPRPSTRAPPKARSRSGHKAGRKPT